MSMLTIQKETRDMQKNEYAAPELKLVGETSDVVLGLPGVGGDYDGQDYIPDFEFYED